MAEVIDGHLRDWLSAHRADLNTRFRKAQKRFPRLSGDAVMGLLSELLPPLAQNPGNKTPALLSSVYDLILLQAGRGLLNRSGSGHAATAHDVLLRTTFPEIVPHLSAKPHSLPGALSNAVENLKGKGPEFALGIAALAPLVNSAQELLDCGAILAWRCGEARLREKALALGRKLPPRAVLLALGVREWPDAAAPLLVAALEQDAWRAPEQHLSPATVRELVNNPRKGTLIKKHLVKKPAAVAKWVPAAVVGDFAGFGGSFEYMPLLLAAGDKGGRHRLWARSGDRNYRIDADIFGCVCTPDPAADFPLLPIEAGRSGLSKMFRALTGKSNSGQTWLAPGGELHFKEQTLVIPELAGARSFYVSNDVVAYTAPDSFRIRVLAPESAPL